jgi:hypothetical protein
VGRRESPDPQAQWPFLFLHPHTHTLLSHVVTFTKSMQKLQTCWVWFEAHILSSVYIFNKLHQRHLVLSKCLMEYRYFFSLPQADRLGLALKWGRVCLTSCSQYNKGGLVQRSRMKIVWTSLGRKTNRGFTRVKVVCGNNVLLFTTHCVFITTLIITLFVNQFVFTTKSGETRKNPFFHWAVLRESWRECGNGDKLGQVSWGANNISRLSERHDFCFFNLVITGA